jgi:hypothetical protein
MCISLYARLHDLFFCRGHWVKTWTWTALTTSIPLTYSPHSQRKHTSPASGLSKSTQPADSTWSDYYSILTRVLAGNQAKRPVAICAESRIPGLIHGVMAAADSWFSSFFGRATCSRAHVGFSAPTRKERDGTSMCRLICVCAHLCKPYVCMCVCVCIYIYIYLRLCCSRAVPISSW